MDGITLEKLKVVMEAKYSGYKKDMEQVKTVTKKAREAVEAEKDKINKTLDRVSSSKARKDIAKMNEQLQKQKEAVAAQEAVIINLKNKYDDLMSGITRDATVSSLEKQLGSAQKALDKLDAQLRPLLEKLNQAEEYEALGLKFPEMDDIREQIDAINPKYDELDATVSRLKKQLEDIRMNPAATTSAEKLKMQIQLAEEKASRLRQTAAVTEKSINHMMNPKETVRKKIQQMIGGMKQLGGQSNSTSSMMNRGLERVSRSLTTFRRRITGLIASAFVFNVLSKGLNSLRESMGKYLQTNDRFNNSLKAVQTNFKVAFMPIYEVALPYINALMDKLAVFSNMVAQFTSALFGRTYDAAKGIDKVTSSMDDLGKSAEKNLGLASFDKLNNITTSESGGGPKGDSPLGPKQEAVEMSDRMKALLAIAQEFKDKLKEIKQDISIGDFFQAGKDVSGLIVWFNNMLADAIAGVDWKGMGKKTGEFLRGLNWTEIMKSLGRVLWEGVKGASSFWFSMFEEAPIETALITTMALWKFRGVGKKISSLISKALPGDVTLPSLGIKIAAVAVTAKIGFDIGKEIGKALFPEGKEYYENFTWTGEGGFFDTLKNTDTGVLLDALDQMWTDLQNNEMFRLLTGTFVFPEKKTFEETKQEWEDLKNSLSGKWNGLERWYTEDVSPWLSKEKWNELGENAKGTMTEKWTEFSGWWDGTGVPRWWQDKVSPWFTKDRWSELGENAKSSMSEKWTEFSGWWDKTGVPAWWETKVAPWFTKEKWLSTLNGMKEGFSTTWSNITSAGATIINSFIGKINEKMHIKWDAFTIAGNQIIPAGDIQLFTIPTIPVSAYAAGGMVPNGQFFVARENGPELVGNVGPGTGVVNNDQIVESVSGGVERGTYRANAPILILMREMIALMKQMAEKTSSESYSGDYMFEYMRTRASEYFERTGEPAFQS